jgi:hypothetical protein
MTKTLTTWSLRLSDSESVRSVAELATLDKRERAF